MGDFREAMTLAEAKAFLAAKAGRSEELAAVERETGRMGRDIAKNHADTAEAIRIVLAALNAIQETVSHDPD